MRDINTGRDGVTGQDGIHGLWPQCQPIQFRVFVCECCGEVRKVSTGGQTGPLNTRCTNHHPPMEMVELVKK